MPEVLRGNLAQLPLLDIIKMLSAGKRSGRLDLVQGAKHGEIYLESGNLVHAVTGTQMGEAGVYTLLGWLEGDFSFVPDVQAPEESIALTTEQMLLEASRKAEQWEDIKEVISTTDMVFNISPSGSTNTVSLKPIEWQVLAQINGVRSVADVAEILELDEFDVAKIIFSLVTAGLLHEAAEPTARYQNLVAEDFFPRLTEAYTEILGPMGPVIIDDEVAAMGESREAFPQQKAAELVERMSLEIADDGKRTEFQRLMLELLQN
jgi:hypothetical protein